MYPDPIVGMACYADGAWHPCGEFVSYDGQNGAINNLRIIDGELYALGAFKYADGVRCGGVAKRVNGRWEPVGIVPDYSGNQLMYDIVKFQGRLVVSGNFRVQEPHMNDIMQLVDSTWVPVCDHCMMGGMDLGRRMAVYKDELYLAGQMYYGSGNPGQGGLRWDGDEWRAIGEVGAGLMTSYQSDVYPPMTEGFLVHDDLLLIYGDFRFADDNGTPGIAIWDGERFCVPAGPPLPMFGTYGMAVYHDSLYVLNQMERGLVRYYDTEFRYQCSPVGVEELPLPEPVRATWDPATGLVVHGLSDGVHELRVFDAQGRLVLEREVRSQGQRSLPVAFSPGSNALYVVVVDGQQAARFGVVD